MFVSRFVLRFASRSAQCCGSTPSGQTKTRSPRARVETTPVGLGVNFWGSGGLLSGDRGMSVTVPPLSRDSPVTVTPSSQSLARCRRLRSRSFARRASISASFASSAFTATLRASASCRSDMSALTAATIISAEAPFASKASRTAALRLTFPPPREAIPGGGRTRDPAAPSLGLFRGGWWCGPC